MPQGDRAGGAPSGAEAEVTWRGYSSYDYGRKPDYVRDVHVKGIGRSCWLRKMSWSDEKRAQDILGVLIAMGFAHRPRFQSDMPANQPEMGWLDQRFDPLLKPNEVRCCRQNDKYESFSWLRRHNPPARWCYAKPILRVGENWYCKKHMKNAPLPPWEGAPDLHYRPHSRSVGKDDFRWIEGPMTPPGSGVYWLQARVEQELECTTDQLWGYVIGVAGRRIPTMGGYRLDDGTMEPFRWRPEDVVVFREKLQVEAAKAAIHHLGVTDELSE